MRNLQTECDNKQSVSANFNRTPILLTFGSTVSFDTRTEAIFGSKPSIRPSTSIFSESAFDFGNSKTTGLCTSPFQGTDASTDKPFVGSKPTVSFLDLGKQSTSNDRLRSHGAEQRSIIPPRNAS